MTKLVEYTVVREHQGDKITEEGPVVHFFAEGETRLADPTVVANLIESGVLALPDVPAEDAPAEKAAPKPRNKAAPKPANKADEAE